MKCGEDHLLAGFETKTFKSIPSIPQQPISKDRHEQCDLGDAHGNLQQSALHRDGSLVETGNGLVLRLQLNLCLLVHVHKSSRKNAEGQCRKHSHL